jgi:thymidylate synthase ThyX
MTISSKIIADSVGVYSPRLTTFQLRYPRFIHAELMTHRVFSRNASSSRAVPVKRIIEDILADTAMPIHWGKNQKGMQADEEMSSPIDILEAYRPGFEDISGSNIWCENPESAWCEAVVTATDYDNWFWLRQHKDAMPEIQMLANMMRDNMNASVPNILQPSEWHLPYITERDFKVSHAQFAMYHSEDRIDPWTLELIKCSAARCARVSYLTHDGDAPSVEADLALYERLVAGERLHVSPVEHQATPDSYMDYSYNGNQWAEPDLSGNFDKGWIQYRKLVPGERHYFHQEAA